MVCGRIGPGDEDFAACVLPQFFFLQRGARRGNAHALQVPGDAVGGREQLLRRSRHLGIDAVDGFAWRLWMADERAHRSSLAFTLRPTITVSTIVATMPAVKIAQ